MIISEKNLEASVYMEKMCFTCGAINTLDTTECLNCGTPYSPNETQPTLATITELDTPQSTPRSGQWEKTDEILIPIPKAVAPFVDGMPDQRSKKRFFASNWKLNLIIILIIISAIVTGSAFALAANRPVVSIAKIATVTPIIATTPTPNRPIQLAIYIDPNGQYTIKVPVTWVAVISQITIQGSTVNVTRFAPQALNKKNVLIVAVGPPNLTLQNTVDILPSFTSATPPSSYTAKNGLSWATINGSVNAVDGTYSAISSQVTQGSNSFFIIGYGNQQVFGLGVTKMFKTIVESLTFTNDES
jgi:ribosomal protein L40E